MAVNAKTDRNVVCTLYAIEKSTILIQQMDPKILIVGTDF